MDATTSPTQPREAFVGSGSEEPPSPPSEDQDSVASGSASPQDGHNLLLNGGPTPAEGAGSDAASRADTDAIPGSAKCLSESAASLPEGSALDSSLLPPVPPPPPSLSIVTPRTKEQKYKEDLDSVREFEPKGLLAYLPTLLAQVIGARESISYETLEFPAATCFIDVCGFTRITEAMRNSPPGSNGIAHHLNNFFSTLLAIVDDTGGDVVQFSGDALLAIWKNDSDIFGGGGGGDDHLRHLAEKAYTCALAVLHATESEHIRFAENTDPIRLGVHISIGIGNVKLAILGGINSSWRYVFMGEGVRECVDIVDLASMDELVMSPKSYEVLSGGEQSPTAAKRISVEAIHAAGCSGAGDDEPVAFKHKPCGADKTFYCKDTGKVLKRNNSLEAFGKLHSTICDAVAAGGGSDAAGVPVARQTEGEFKVKVTRFLFDTITNTWGKDGEMRVVSSIFIQLSISEQPKGKGASPSAAVDYLLQFIVSVVQDDLARRDGTLNKVLFDDKGALLLCLFGLPGHAHEDDCFRALDFAQAVCDKLDDPDNLKDYFPPFSASFGISRSKVYCGVCGSRGRREYTVLGDGVNVAARVMQYASRSVTRRDSGGPVGERRTAIFCDDQTRALTARLGMFIFTGGTEVKMKGKSLGCKVWGLAGREDRHALPGGTRKRNTHGDTSAGGSPMAGGPSSRKDTIGAWCVPATEHTQPASGAASPSPQSGAAGIQVFGRESELLVGYSAVMAAQRAAAQGLSLGDSHPADRAVTIHGDSSMGKTLMLDKIAEFAMSQVGSAVDSPGPDTPSIPPAASQPPALHFVACSPLESGTPYHLIASVLRPIAGTHSTDWVCWEADAAEAGGGLRPLLNPVLPPEMQFADTEASLQLSDAEREDLLKAFAVGIIEREYSGSGAGAFRKHSAQCSTPKGSRSAGCRTPPPVPPSGALPELGWSGCGSAVTEGDAAPVPSGGGASLPLALSARPVVICVDNLHLCDAQSLGVLTHIARSMPTVAIVAATKTLGGGGHAQPKAIRTGLRAAAHQQQQSPGVQMLGVPRPQHLQADSNSREAKSLKLWGGSNCFEGSGPSAHVKLNPLDRRSIAGLLRKLSGATVHDDIVGIIFAKSGGNPGFAEQIFVSLVDLTTPDADIPPGSIRSNPDAEGPAEELNPIVASLLSGSGGVLHIKEAPRLPESLCKEYIISFQDGVDAASLPLPDGIEGIIAGRVDRLSANLQNCLKCASVVGSTFSLSVMRRVVKGSESNAVAEWLLKLEHMGFLTSGGHAPDATRARKSRDGTVTSHSGHLRGSTSLQFGEGSTYSFRLQAMRDVLYSILLPGEKRDMHLLVAEELEKDHLANVVVDPSSLVTHFTQAGVPNRAVLYYGLAADIRFLSGSIAPALALYQKAVEIASGMEEGDPLKPKGGVRYHWLAMVANLLCSVGDIAGAEQAASKVLSDVASQPQLRSEVWSFRPGRGVHPEGGSVAHPAFSTSHGGSCHLAVHNALGWKRLLKLTEGRAAAYVVHRHEAAAAEAEENPGIPAAGNPIRGSAPTDSINWSASGAGVVRLEHSEMASRNMSASSRSLGLRRTSCPSTLRGIPIGAGENQQGCRSSLKKGLMYYKRDSDEVSVVDIFLARHVLAQVCTADGGRQLMRHHAISALLVLEHYADLLMGFHQHCVDQAKATQAPAGAGKEGGGGTAWGKRCRDVSRDARRFEDGFKTVAYAKRGVLMMIADMSDPKHTYFGIGSNRGKAAPDAVKAMERAVSRYPDDFVAVERFGVLMCCHFGDSKTVEHYQSHHRTVHYDTDFATAGVFYLTACVFGCFTSRPSDTSARLVELAKLSNSKDHKRIEACAALMSLYVDILFVGHASAAKHATMSLAKLQLAQGIVLPQDTRHSLSGQASSGWRMGLCADRQLVLLLQCIAALVDAEFAVEGADLQRLEAVAVLLDEAHQFPHTYVLMVALHSFVEALVHPKVAVMTRENGGLRQAAKAALRTMGSVARTLPAWNAAVHLSQASVEVWRNGTTGKSARKKTRVSLDACFVEANLACMPYFAARSLALESMLVDDEDSRVEQQRLAAEVFMKAGSCQALQARFMTLGQS